MTERDPEEWSEDDKIMALFGFLWIDGKYVSFNYELKDSKRRSRSRNSTMKTQGGCPAGEPPWIA